MHTSLGHALHQRPSSRHLSPRCRPGAARFVTFPTHLLKVPRKVVIKVALRVQDREEFLDQGAVVQPRQMIDNRVHLLTIAKGTSISA